MASTSLGRVFFGFERLRTSAVRDAHRIQALPPQKRDGLLHVRRALGTGHSRIGTSKLWDSAIGRLQSNHLSVLAILLDHACSIQSHPAHLMEIGVLCLSPLASVS